MGKEIRVYRPEGMLRWLYCGGAWSQAPPPGRGTLGFAAIPRVLQRTLKRQRVRGQVLETSPSALLFICLSQEPLSISEATAVLVVTKVQ
jgi:hypothetical protein